MAVISTALFAMAALCSGVALLLSAVVVSFCHTALMSNAQPLFLLLMAVGAIFGNSAIFFVPGCARWDRNGGLPLPY
eukprot:5988875-Prymnesium_polylepis.1